MIKQTNNGAVVDTGWFWLSIAHNTPPRGCKMLLVNKPDGVALLGNYREGDHFTHWAPLPRFREIYDE